MGQKQKKRQKQKNRQKQKIEINKKERLNEKRQKEKRKMTHTEYEIERRIKPQNLFLKVEKNRNTKLKDVTLLKKLQLKFIIFFLLGMRMRRQRGVEKDRERKKGVRGSVCE